MHSWGPDLVNKFISISISITLIFYSIYKAYYISNQKQKKVDIFKFFKDEVNNVFDTIQYNIFIPIKVPQGAITNIHS